MTALCKVKEIERLVAEGRLSFRNIAKAVGASRATVAAIAHGERPDYATRLARDQTTYVPVGPLMRCSSCGGRVYSPCRLCEVRRHMSRDEDIARVLRQRARDQQLRRLLIAIREINLRRAGMNLGAPQPTRPSPAGAA